MANIQIMVVEDEMIVAEDIKRSLLNMGYEVPAIVSSGEEAVKMAEETRPDLILMDILLKGVMDGIEAASQIHSALNIPFIYLTAYANDAIIERAKKTAPSGYIVKPFEDAELYSSIEVALYKHKMEKELKAQMKKIEETNKAFIGREIKMIEKENEELKKSLKDK